MSILKESMTAIGKTVKPVVSKVTSAVGPRAPEILLVGGIVATVAGGVTACVVTAKKVPEILDDRDEAVEEAQRTADSEEEAKDGKFRAYLWTCGKLVKAYALPASMAALGVGCIVASHNIQRNRITMLAGAYNTLLASFNTYRERVIADQGVDADRRYLHGTHEETGVIVKQNKKGEDVEKETSTVVLGSGTGEEMYYRCYDSANSTEWRNDADYNLEWVKAVERRANDKLAERGRVYLSEIYEALGFDVDEYTNCRIVGWTIDHDDPTNSRRKISFGIYEEAMATNLAFIRGWEPSIWLSFNCDGVIIDKI